MEDWVYRALAKWPNVPALYGWLRLDRRGRWLIKGEPISRPQILDTIGRNYAADERGAWYFQNGPQRGYVELDYAPLVLRVDGRGRLRTHTDLPVEHPTAAWLDEEGAVLLSTEHGPGLIDQDDLEWTLARLVRGARPADEVAIAAALTLPSGTGTDLALVLPSARLPLQRLDAARAPQVLGYLRQPQAPGPAA